MFVSQSSVEVWSPKPAVAGEAEESRTRRAQRRVQGGESRGGEAAAAKADEGVLATVPGAARPRKAGSATWPRWRRTPGIIKILYTPSISNPLLFPPALR